MIATREKQNIEQYFGGGSRGLVGDGLGIGVTTGAEGWRNAGYVQRTCIGAN